ncbi:hypothetical protein [Georgenia daeguensis]
MTTTTTRSALPGRMVDLIRDGVPPADLRAKGDRAVWAALVKTAASSQQRGHTYAEWAAIVTDAKSALGRQASIRAGRDKVKSPAAREKTLRSAWDAAARWLKDAPASFTRETVLAHVAAVRGWAGDADADLDDHERMVLIAACDVAERNGTTRPAMPRRAVSEATGLGERTVRTTLAALDDRGILRLEVPGRGGAEGKRRAGLYQLPTADVMADAYLYRETRSMGHPAQVYGTPRDASAGTPAQVYGTPDTEGTTTMVTLTLTAADPEQLALALAAITRDPGVQVITSASDDSNVVELASVRRSS